MVEKTNENAKKNELVHRSYELVTARLEKLATFAYWMVPAFGATAEYSQPSDEMTDPGVLGDRTAAVRECLQAIERIARAS